MGLLYGTHNKDGYQPGRVHEWLKPDVSGNAINGLDETDYRQPTPVFHRRWHKHPWYKVQQLFYIREMWDPIQTYSYLGSYWMETVIGHPKPARTKEQDTPENWSRRAKEHALKHPGTDLVGITRLTADLIFDREYQNGELTEHQYKDVKDPWVIMIAGAMDYSELSKSLKQNKMRIAGKVTPFWKNGFLKGAQEVLRTYLRTQKAAWDLAKWIRSKGYLAYGHGGPRGGPVVTLAAAHAAGLGQLGKHGSLMSEKLGACQRFSFVITDMPLVADGPVDIGVDEYCVNCQACNNICPPKALSKEKRWVRGVKKWYVDFDRCEPYFNEYHGCSLCLSICPWSRPGTASKLVQRMQKKRAKAGQDKPQTNAAQTT